MCEARGRFARRANADGRIELGQRAAGGRARRKSPEKMPGGVKRVDKAVAGAFLIVGVVGPQLLGIAHKQSTVDVLDAEGGEAGRFIRVGERVEAVRAQRHFLKVFVEDVDLVVVEIGGIEKIALAITAQRQQLVDPRRCPIDRRREWPASC